MSKRMIEIAEGVLVYMKATPGPMSWVQIAEETGLDWRAVRSVLRDGGFAGQEANGLWALLPHVPKTIKSVKSLDS